MSSWPYCFRLLNAGIRTAGTSEDTLKGVLRPKESPQGREPFGWKEHVGKDPSAHPYLLLRPELMLDSSCLSFSTNFSLSALRSMT